MSVAILIGSESDYDVVKDALGVLREFEIPFLPGCDLGSPLSRPDPALGQIR